MGQEIVYCGNCGNRILHTEFEEGRAVTILEKNYCSKCSKALKQGKEPPVAREVVSSRTSQRVRRITSVDTQGGPRRHHLSRMLILAVVIGVLTFILILVVVMRSR